MLGHVPVGVDLAQVVARGEVRPLRGEDDDLDLVVLGRGVERRVQLVEEPRVLGIARLGPVQHDAGDVLGGGLVQDGVEGLHGCGSSRARRAFEKSGLRFSRNAFTASWCSGLA